MVQEQSANLEQCQRIEVAFETQGAASCYKITVERYDAQLGWYTAGAITLPAHQLPLLQQALTEIGQTAPSATETADNIIPFPTLAEIRK